MEDGPAAFIATSAAPPDSTMSWALPWILSSGLPACLGCGLVEHPAIRQAPAQEGRRCVHCWSSVVPSLSDD
jgi:hypothetical protein